MTHITDDTLIAQEVSRTELVNRGESTCVKCDGKCKEHKTSFVAVSNGAHFWMQVFELEKQ